jgi:cyclopropane fatty-acyl-phospholipid synthase-like methyltransferase
MKINEKGFWENQTGEGHAHDTRLAIAIQKLLTKKGYKSLVDFGCGMGQYVKQFTKQGIKCQAYDGNPNTNNLTAGVGQVLDLSQHFELGQVFDCVMSLEVGEHIPDKFESTFLNNITNHACGVVILSWAIPGQDGDGHVNCRSNEYIIQQMLIRGFTFEIDETQKLRRAASLWWFKNSIMVFS